MILSSLMPGRWLAQGVGILRRCTGCGVLSLNVPWSLLRPHPVGAKTILSLRKADSGCCTWSCLFHMSTYFCAKVWDICNLMQFNPNYSRCLNYFPTFIHNGDFWHHGHKLLLLPWNSHLFFKVRIVSWRILTALDNSSSHFSSFLFGHKRSNYRNCKFYLI